METGSRLPIIVLIASLLLGACAGPDQAPPAPQGNERQVTIGFTVSQTGSLNVESTRQTNGLNLWMKQVNDAGGIKLQDGTVVKHRKQMGVFQFRGEPQRPTRSAAQRGATQKIRC